MEFVNFIIFSLLVYFILYFLNKVVNQEYIEIDDEEEMIKLKDLEKPLPSPNDPEIFYIPIIHTNDIHGSFYPKQMVLPSNNTFSVGGLGYLGKYVSIMYKEWGNRLLFFDTGDQFQGAIEGHISKGRIIMDFFNELKMHGSVIGNHEFDFGIDFLYDYMNSSKFNWTVDNIKNLTTNEYITFPNQNTSTILEIEGYKIGIIGLVTLSTPGATKTDLTDLKFENYLGIVNRESSKLKKRGANAIIVLGHLGVKCKDDSEEIGLEYKLRDINKKQSACREEDHAFVLLNKLKNDTIDLFLGGHKHYVSHDWINGIPFISNDLNGKYAQIVYLPFNRTTKKLIKEKILMEGPLPICEKLFKNKKLCDFNILNKEQEENCGKLLNFTFHDIKITKDEKISKIGDKYRPLFNEYNKDNLTVTHNYFESTKKKENFMGNFYTDFLRHISGADISVVNPGVFRTPFYKGKITNATIYSFDPFDNDLVIFQAYGWEIKKMFYQLQRGGKAFYPTSGLKMVVKDSPKKELLSIKLFDGVKEKEILDNELYSIVSNEFCFPLEPGDSGGNDFKKVYKWFKPRNGSYVNVGNFNNSRDILIDYMRKIDELKGNKYYKDDNPKLRIFKEN